MDVQEAESQRAIGAVASAITLIGAMATGFAEFPVHARFVAAVLILIHVCAVSVISVVKAERQQADRILWFQVLTLRLGLVDLALESASGRAASDVADRLWRSASARALEDIKTNDDNKVFAAKLGLPPYLSLVIRVSAVVLYYAAAIGIAQVVRRFIL